MWESQLFDVTNFTKDMNTNIRNRRKLFLLKFALLFFCTFTKKSLATLGGEIADPEITVKLEMRDVL